ncbi:MAG TPA: DUF222 domain-containing protein [Candidatus Dormibacteraeota bacterium]
MDYPSVSLENQGLARALEDEICEVSAHAHAAMAQVARASARFDAIGGWCAGGIRSFPHWMTINAGFDMRTASELVRVGQCLESLPRISEAFKSGRLSFDKVRQITTVATPASEEVLLGVAQGASGTQLARICHELRRIADAEAPKRAEEQLAQRGLWMHWDDDGMLVLMARLTAEDAAVVKAALESITGSQPVRPAVDDAIDPADDRWAARRSDALVAMSEHVLAGGAESLVTSPAARQVVVHVDARVLTGESSEGRCFVEGGAPLSAAAALRLGCDAEAICLVERDGLPIDVGRKQRIVPDKLRLALHVRDRFCRFPGCSVPAQRTEAHHFEHWAFGGPTNLDNLLLLCGFHHRRHHDGAYRIRKSAHGFSFETDDGHVIQPPPRDPVGFDRGVPALLRSRHPEITAGIPVAEWGGADMDFDYAVSVTADACAFAEARARDG